MNKMSFADFKKFGSKSNFRKNEFFKFSLGQHVFRVLSPKAVVFDTHYTHDITLLCLGDDCPICQNNRSMFKEFGKDAAKMPGFVSQRQVGYINVLDRTPAKVCPNSECQEAVKKNGAAWPVTCPKCGASLVGVVAAPMNKVKIISKGKQFFDQLEYFDAAILDESETPIGITHYDCEALVTDLKKTPAINARSDKNDVVEVPEDALFDLENAPIKLDPDEIREVLRGVRLADIFAARRATSTPATPDAPTGNAEAKKEIQEGLNSIFEN